MAGGGNPALPFAMNVERAKESLLKLKHDLDSRGVEFWLREGTLLAAVRDGDFFEWDHDIDISVMAEQFTEELADDLSRNGWGTGRFVMPENYPIQGPTQYTLRRFPMVEGDLGIDIMLQFYWPERGTYVTLHPPFGGSMRTEIPRDFLNRANYIEFLGERFRIPCYPEMVLQSIYGDWRTPHKDHDGSWFKNWGEWR